MKTLTWLTAVLLSTVACSKKKTEDKAPDPGSSTKKVAEPKSKPPTGALQDVTVTSKSADAIAAFEKGRTLMEHARGGEATEHFQKAIELDPEFATAHAYLGLVTPGAAGTEHLAKAGTLAAKLPEAERELIAGNQALRAGDDAKAIASFEKVLQLAPGAWRVDLVLGNISNNGTLDGAALSTKRFEHALSIKPDLAIAHNGLAYAYATKREWDPAIAAAKKQVELLPEEPNPLDTLAEVLLWSGKFEDSEQAFAAAVKLEPKFTIAWQGVALARAYRGDYKGAYQAYEQQKQTVNPGEKFEPVIDMAWISMAEDNLPQAMAHLDALENDAEAKLLPIHAFGAVERGHMLTFASKHADAAKWFATALIRVDALGGDGRVNLLRGHAIGMLRIAALGGKPAADADQLVAVLEDGAKAAPDDAGAQEGAAWARGLAAWARTGAKDAVAELSKCSRNQVACRWDLMQAQRQAGDAAGADATAKEIIETPRRDAGVVYLISHVTKK